MTDDTKEQLMNSTAAAQQYEFEDDGLSSFSLEQLGQKVSAFGGARLLKFVSGGFITREHEVITPNREFILLGLVKAVQKLVGKKLMDTIPVPPREKFPDVEAMNLKASREEWGVDLNGKPEGPFKHVLALKLLDATPAMDRYVFVTSSIGGMIAFGDISDKVRLIRRLKGPDVTVVITCESVMMRSRFNPLGIPRPHFRVVRYVRLGGDTVTLPSSQPPKTLPPTPTPSPTPTPTPTPMPAAATVTRMTTTEQLDTFASAPDVAPAPRLEMTTVSEPTLKDEMADELPF